MMHNSVTLNARENRRSIMLQVGATPWLRRALHQTPYRHALQGSGRSLFDDEEHDKR